MVKKVTTIDDLAKLLKVELNIAKHDILADVHRELTSVRSELTEVKGEIGSLAVATKNRFKEVHSELVEFHKDFDVLNRMTKNGFDETATKEDFKLLANGLRLSADDRHDLKNITSALVRMDTEQDKEIVSLKTRVTKLEHKTA